MTNAVQEHLASRQEVWLDFMADTGDGGNSTYAVARALAAPQLPVVTPAHLSDLGYSLAAGSDGDWPWIT